MKNRFFVQDWFELLSPQIICSLNPLRKLVEIGSIFGCSLFFKLIISTQFRRCQLCQAQIMIIQRPVLQSGLSFQNKNIVTSWFCSTFQQIHCRARERERGGKCVHLHVYIMRTFYDPIFWDYTLFHFITYITNTL